MIKKDFFIQTNQELEGILKDFLERNSNCVVAGCEDFNLRINLWSWESVFDNSFKDDWYIYCESKRTINYFNRIWEDWVVNYNNNRYVNLLRNNR